MITYITCCLWEGGIVADPEPDTDRLSERRPPACLAREVAHDNRARADARAPALDPGASVGGRVVTQRASLLAARGGPSGALRTPPQAACRSRALLEWTWLRVWHLLERRLQRPVQPVSHRDEWWRAPRRAPSWSAAAGPPRGWWRRQWPKSPFALDPPPPRRVGRVRSPSNVLRGPAEGGLVANGQNVCRSARSTLQLARAAQRSPFGSRTAMAARAPAVFAAARESVETATSPDAVINYSCVETRVTLSGMNMHYSWLTPLHTSCKWRVVWFSTTILASIVASICKVVQCIFSSLVQYMKMCHTVSFRVGFYEMHCMGTKADNSRIVNYRTLHVWRMEYTRNYLLKLISCSWETCCSRDRVSSSMRRPLEASSLRLRGTTASSSLWRASALGESVDSCTIYKKTNKKNTTIRLIE